MSERGIFQVPERERAAKGAKCIFAATNFTRGKGRKTGVFCVGKKTLKKVRKNACIENPDLISYSPVAPLKATPRVEATIDL